LATTKGEPRPSLDGNARRLPSCSGTDCGGWRAGSNTARAVGRTFADQGPRIGPIEPSSSFAFRIAASAPAFAAGTVHAESVGYQH
jgi:hypothetical protein